MCATLCVFSIPPVSAPLIWMGPFGMEQTADEPAIHQIQPAHHPKAHDNSCTVPAQRQGCKLQRLHHEERREGETEKGRGFTEKLVNA